MTECKESELLRDILLDAAIEEFAPEFLSTEPVETSRKFQKSMQSLCNNPTKWAKQKQNPSWKKAVKMAAAILLICILSIGMLTLISPKAYTYALFIKSYSVDMNNASNGLVWDAINIYRCVINLFRGKLFPRQSFKSCFNT